MLASSVACYANSDPVFFDFEDYKTDHSSPAGWPSSNTWELGPYTVDDTHGTSLKVKNKGLPIYKFAEPVQDGEFLVSFEIYFEDFDQNLRLHAKSPTSGSDAHSLIQFTGGQVNCANTAGGAWVFDKMTTIETKHWYQIDLLFNMDSGKLYYYIDGEEYATKPIAFSDMSHIYFRTESGKTNDAVLYLDNVSFKYKSAGGFDSEFRGGAAQIGKEDVILNFQDLVDSETINNIEIYNMGSNPFSYSSHKLDAEILMEGGKQVKLQLSEPLKKSSIYKVYAPGVKSVYGELFKNDSVYFATGGRSENRVSLDADFSTMTETGNRKPISPASDVTWTKSVNNKINPVVAENIDGESVPMVRFVQNKGSSDLPDNLLTLERTIDDPYTEAVKLEVMLKAKNGKQVLRVKDADGGSFDFVRIIGSDILVNGEKAGEIAADTWCNIEVELDTDTGSYAVIIDGNEAYTGEFSGINAVAGIVFEQRNSTETYGTNTPTEELAEMLIAYFRIYSWEECNSVILASFEDTDGDIHYPDGEIPTDIKKVRFTFSSELNPDTVANGIEILKNGVLVSDDCEYTDGVFSVILPDYLSGFSEYAVKINSSIKDIDDKAVMSQEGLVKTDKGLFIGKSFGMADGADGYTVCADLIHTDLSCNDIFVSVGYFKDNLMIDYKLDRIAPTADDRKIEFSKVYEKNEDADKVVAFLWDGFDTANSILKSQIINK